MTLPRKDGLWIVVVIAAVIVAVVVLTMTVFFLLTARGPDEPQYERFNPIRAPQAAAEAHGRRREAPGR
jgi:flagellar basal body-associated protein FliL